MTFFFPLLSDIKYIDFLRKKKRMNKTKEENRSKTLKKKLLEYS